MVTKDKNKPLNRDAIAFKTFCQFSKTSLHTIKAGYER